MNDSNHEVLTRSCPQQS